MLYSEKAMLTKCISGSVKILGEYFPIYLCINSKDIT
jgi:hypothetical protein